MGPAWQPTLPKSMTAMTTEALVRRRQDSLLFTTAATYSSRGGYHKSNALQDPSGPPLEHRP
jgi:hypothetical protein